VPTARKVRDDGLLFECKGRTRRFDSDHLSTDTITSFVTIERTREVVLDGIKKVQDSFLEHDLVANIRLETYEGERYFHVPPTSTLN
jgi:hypothetical protein